MSALPYVHGGFNDSERYSYKELVYSHLIKSMRTLLKALPNLELSLTPESDAYRMVIFSLPAKFEFDILFPDVAHALRSLLLDAAVQEALRRRHEFNLKDSATYFFEAIERVSAISYLPTDSDILHCEKNETTITETIFKANQSTYKLTTLTYQQAQTWIHYLDNVKALVFVVSLKEYDHLFDGVNRLKVAQNEFFLICNWRLFILTPLVLLLNDADAFAEKLPSSPLIDYFLDYHGDNSYEDACAYIVGRFVTLNRHPLSKPIYHYIIPRDTENLEDVLNTIQRVVVK
ncbi:hypothetical protein GALMADRAFT_138132 [Galerina marginata CBS 339.88]|uniref:Uncharacterized protein n=1 Tax=Galerina marginata (strain CBS 339.88) TaxID=685588 RepID=A0A067TGA4_GALM3|nr:hypothetical protein GALMADRAFT_138132 [Galerina marginata CBS 339.88]